MKFAISLVLSCLNSVTLAQVFCSELCVYSSLAKDNNVLITVTAPSTTGYAAFGFGASMAKAEVYVVSLDGKKGIVTRRESTGRSQPKLATDQELLVIQNNTGIFNGLMQIQFLRPLRPKALSATTAAVVLSQSSTNTKFIWAISPTKPNGGSIVQHTSFGSEAGNMFAKASAFTSAESNFVVNKDRENYVLLHGILMTLAWFVCAPAGIAVARFFKAKLGKWWFRIHVFLMFLCVGVLSAIGLALAVVAVESVSDEPAVHFSPSNYAAAAPFAGSAHVVLGLVVMIILSLQLIGGVVIDKLFDPSRTKTPLTDKLHWWGGRLSVLGGIVNVFLGLVLYNAIFTASATSVFIIIVSIFLVVIVAFFAIAQRLMGQSHDNASEEKGFEMKDY